MSVYQNMWLTIISFWFLGEILYFLFCRVLGHSSHSLAQLTGIQETITVTVKQLERLLQLCNSQDNNCYIMDRRDINALIEKCKVKTVFKKYVNYAGKI